MKKLLSVILAGLALVACGGNSYNIKGELEGVADSTVVTLNVIENGELSPIDSAILKGGKFRFQGETDTCRLAFVTFNDLDGAMSGCQLFLEKGSIKVRFSQITGEQHTSGTVNNNAFQDFYDKTGVLNDKAEELEDKLRITAASDGDGTGLVEEMNALQDEFRLLVAQSISDNADNEFGYQQLLESYDMFEPEELAEFIEALAPAFGNREEMGILSEMTSQQLRTANGAQYSDFECDMLDSSFETPSKAKLSSFVSQNKLVLLDFWASWCSPCMNEVPFVKAAFEKYAEKGFTVVSVSVDDDLQDWKDAVRENGMTWPQLWNGNDAQGETAARLYSVSAIPSTFLIDSEGTIIGRNLRGEELEAALADYFK